MLKPWKTIRALSLGALILSFVLPVQPAQALFLYRPATQWGFTYAAPASQSQAFPSPTAAKNIEAQSKFVVKYTNFPDWAKTDVQAALDVWAAHFKSSVPINVEATFGRSSSYGVLGSARAGGYFSAFKGAPDSTLWYPSALANALAGKDLDKENPEIVIQVNSTAAWDTRNDGKPTKREYDMQSVIIHELGHGLGFLSTDSYNLARDPATRVIIASGLLDQPTAFDAYLQTQDGRRLSDLPSPSTELATALTNTLVWTGAKGVAANNGVPPKMYTPTTYQDGSSVSHLDEDTFSNTGANAVMTPNLEAGEVFHELGPLLIAMMEDLRAKPPVGKPSAIPTEVRNAEALKGDGQVIVTFDPPANARPAQITSYLIKNNKTGAERQVSSSPVVIDGLKNGVSYTFTITANNDLGTSDPITTTQVIPQAGWKRSVIDPLADAKNLTAITYNGQPAIAYTDSIGGSLKLALYTGTKWQTMVVDGAGGAGGRTRHVIDGPVSLCTNTVKKKQILHIFYTDKDDQDLRYTSYNGKLGSVEIVDGNGPSVNKYEDPVRVRTSSDVSLTNACVATADGIQVFYRDETQGILLGAIKQPDIGTWEYELVDGDRKTDGRTTGDVGFHLRAMNDGKNTYVIYDSVLGINAKREATQGAVRIATRPNLDPDVWVYKTLDISDFEHAVAGYGVALAKSGKSVLATWFTSTTATLPKASQIRWTLLSSPSDISSSTTQGFGTPRSGIVTDGKNIIFNCQERLCSMDTTIKSGNQNAISVISNFASVDPINSVWITIKNVNYLAAGIGGKLSLFKA